MKISDDLLRLLADVELLISERCDQVDVEMIAAGVKLRLIRRLGSRTYDFDLDAARGGTPTPRSAAVAPQCFWARPLLWRLFGLLQLLAQF